MCYLCSILLHSGFPYYLLTRLMQARIFFVRCSGCSLEDSSIATAYFCTTSDLHRGRQTILQCSVFSISLEALYPPHLYSLFILFNSSPTFLCFSIPTSFYFFPLPLHTSSFKPKDTHKSWGASTFFIMYNYTHT